MKRNKKTVKKTSFAVRFGTAKERNYIIENLSTLVVSHVNVIDAFLSIKHEIKSKSLRAVLDDILVHIQGGTPLWSAMEKSGLFTDSMISLIKIGEKTGRLPESLNVIAERNKKDRIFRSKLKSAMMYPLFVLGLTVVIGGGIAWFILPKLSTVFGQLKLELPLVTKVIIRTGEILGEHGVFIVPGVFMFMILVLLFLFVFKKTKHIGRAILMYVPGIGRLIREVEIARFGYLFGTLIKSGVPISEALASLIEATQTRSYKRLYVFMQKSLDHGYTLGYIFKHFSKSRALIPGPMQQMVVTGEQSGRLPESLMSISEIYEEKLDNTTKNVAVLLEPILLVVVWAGVMTIALAVILPIYSLLGGVR